MNGTNSAVYAFFDDMGELMLLDTMSSLSFTSSAEINPVFALGISGVTGYTYGAKVISGVMQFVATERLPFADLSSYVNKKWNAVYDKVTEYEMDMQNNSDDSFDIEPETLPPFGMLIISEPELPKVYYGSNSKVPTITYFVISGIKITSLTNQMDSESGQGLWRAEYMASQLMRHSLAAMNGVTAKSIFEQAKSNFVFPSGTESLSNAIRAHLGSGG